MRDYAVRFWCGSLATDFLAFDDSSWEGVLKHGTYHETKNLGVDESVMWGDYWSARRGRHDRANCASERPGGRG